MGRLFSCLVAMLLCCVAISASAQTKPLAKDLEAKDDRGFIAGLLEDSLGGDGRIVRVEGFQGALSSIAKIERLTIADDTGVWLTLNDISLKWNRSALLRGQIEIEQLSAASLALTRPPNAPIDALPAAEATGFSLPNLPVSVVIDVLNIERIELGEAVLGEPAEMSLEASARLAGGSGDVQLTAVRTDGKDGQFLIDASYSADTKLAAVKIDLTEARDGIAARMLNLPGRPNLKLQVSGDGSIDDLVTDLSLETDGVERLKGQVTLNGSTDTGRAFGLVLDGDLTALMPSEYHAFFGSKSSLRATGQQAADGALELSELDLQTNALSIKGAAAFDKNYAPQRLALSGKIEPATGESVVLPIGGVRTSIARAGLEISYEKAASDAVEVALSIDDLDSQSIAIRDIQMTITGALASALEADSNIRAAVTFAAAGAQFADAAQQQAFGQNFDGSLRLDYQPTGQLLITDINLVGQQYDLTGDLRVEGPDEAFQTEIDVTLAADRLARFSALVGTDLNGQAKLAIVGTADLGGVFNLQLAGTTTDLGIGIAQADKALAGVTKLDFVVVRDETGVQVPSLNIQNPQLNAKGAATLKTDASKVEFDVTLVNSAQIDPRLRGAVTLVGKANQDANGWIVDTSLSGPFGAKSTVTGRATGANPALRFDLKIPDIQPIAGQFRGAAALSGTATKTGEVWNVRTTLAGPYGVNGTLSGAVSGAATNLRYDLRIPDVASLGAQISGPLAIEGTAAQQSSAWQIETALSGLGGTRATLSGRVLSNGDLDLSARGAAPLSLANPFLAPRNLQGRATFDLMMRGPASLSSLSGTINTADARLAVPNLRISFTDIDAQTTIARGRAQIDASAGVSSGGRIALRGPVVLTAGLSADLAIVLDAVRLVDPTLYDTPVNGQLSVRGPLAGGALIAGALNIGETSIRVPESRVAGYSIVPQIAHRKPTAGVVRTLDRAGLSSKSNSSASAASGVSYGLDIRIDAPAKIFVRGRGLDAELGGALRLQGTTRQMISTGRFNLIRGRIDILSQRFVLDEGSISMQGKLDPLLRFVATTKTSTGTASITIEGPASDPSVSFSSSPEAPEEEVLAQIFFGRDISTLSALQALQLASAVATLSGRGGDGIISKLRRGFGLDDLDITTDADGNTGLLLGKYISDNVYTNVTVGSDSSTGVSINIDLSPSLTARGAVTSDGNSSVGIYFEKDY